MSLGKRLGAGYSGVPFKTFGFKPAHKCRPYYPSRGRLSTESTDIGLTLKIIVDQFPGVSLYVSGSSALELQNRTNESLTGRKWGFTLLPVSYEEYENAHGVWYAFQQLENRLLFGMYPEVLNASGQEKDILKELVSSYLYKDILAYADIRKSDKLEKLVQALALQIGSEVKFSELANLLDLDKNTVGNYIDILEKGFIIF